MKLVLNDIGESVERVHRVEGVHCVDRENSFVDESRICHHHADNR